LRPPYRYRYLVAILLLASGVLLSASMDSGNAQAGAMASEYSAVEPLAFELSYLGGSLSISGHSASSEHEQAVAAGAQLFDQADVNLRPAVVAPDDWPDITTAVLHAVAASQSATAEVSEDEVRLRAVYVDVGDWQAALDELNSALPESVTLQTETLHVAAQLADPCLVAYRELQKQSVKFERSSAELRSANFGVLDRHVEFASNCSDYRIAVTGHTDNQGDEEWNTELSRLRAQAVADYLQQRGVPERQLLVDGAGSAEPVANNETAWGRIRNRRIEFALVSLSHPPPGP
jgi:OOP family OmpA-OmpF porin